VHVEAKAIETQLEIYLNLIEITLKIKNEFETEIHPQALVKYQNQYYEIILHLITLTLDLVKIPRVENGVRQFFYDLIIEHANKKIITKEHLLEMLMNWENHDIIEQAE
jgi:hypothetical protein